MYTCNEKSLELRDENKIILQNHGKQYSNSVVKPSLIGQRQIFAYINYMRK